MIFVAIFGYMFSPFRFLWPYIENWYWITVSRMLVKANCQDSKETNFISNTSLWIRPRLSRCTIHISRPFIFIHSVGTEKLRQQLCCVQPDVLWFYRQAASSLYCCYHLTYTELKAAALTNEWNAFCLRLKVVCIY